MQMLEAAFTVFEGSADFGEEDRHDPNAVEKDPPPTSEWYWQTAS